MCRHYDGECVYFAGRSVGGTLQEGGGVCRLGEDEGIHSGGEEVPTPLPLLPAPQVRPAWPGGLPYCQVSPLHDTYTSTFLPS